MLIIQEKKENVLRLPVIPDFEKGKSHKVFVVENDKAEKKEVSLGVKGNRFCEVASGLSEGDVIITDGMNAYRQHNEIEIRK
jgi:hypothetical protein